MKIAKFFLIMLIAVAFVLVPLPKADLFFRVYFMDVEGTTCNLYYTTRSSNAFSAEQMIPADIDYELGRVTFQLDSALAEELTGVRLDFPNAEHLVCINNVTLSSAGIIQKQFNPCDFFAYENLIQTNDIQDMSLVRTNNRAYFLTGSTDPFVVFSDNIVAQIVDGYSSYRLTRLGICLFLAAVYFIAKKNIFSKSEEEKTME